MSHLPSSGRAVAQHRQRRGWSQAHLAEQCGVSRTEISGIENDRLVPSVSVALRLAAILDTSVESLFSEATAAGPAVTWALPPADASDARVWRATVGERLLVYPVEWTAAGAIAHDSLVENGLIDVVAPGIQPDRTLVIAGCDPLVGLIVQTMAEQHGVRVLPLLRSSAQAIDLLQRGLVHVAGLHLTDVNGHSANDRGVRDRLGAGHCLMHQLRWEAGIVLAPG